MCGPEANCDPRKRCTDRQSAGNAEVDEGTLGASLVTRRVLGRNGNGGLHSRAIEIGVDLKKSAQLLQPFADPRQTDSDAAKNQKDAGRSSRECG